MHSIQQTLLFYLFLVSPIVSICIMPLSFAGLLYSLTRLVFAPFLPSFALQSGIQPMAGTFALNGKMGQQLGNVLQISRRENLWKLMSTMSPRNCMIFLQLFDGSLVCSRCAAVSCFNKIYYTITHKFGIEVPKRWDDCVILDT
jgi:hypothetical protein